MGTVLVAMMVGGVVEFELEVLEGSMVLCRLLELEVASHKELV